MWILVVGRGDALERTDGGAATLRDLGCRVRAADLWDELDTVIEREKAPPAAILIEALDMVDAGKAALVRVRAVTALRDVPCILAVTVPALQRLNTGDGFDDFVLVPYVPAELYVRVRRAEWKTSDFEDQERIKIGGLCLDLAAHEVTIDGRPIVLTHQEFALLRFLAEHRGRVFEREQLLSRAWGVDYYGGSRTVDIHIRRLRSKLGHAGDAIETVRGVGYKMRAP